MGQAGTCLVGYDVECSWQPDTTAQFFARVTALHRDLGVPCTFYVTGQVAEQHPDWLARIAADPLFDVAQHTYSHRLLKTVVVENAHGTTLVPGATLTEIQEEVEQASAAVARATGQRPSGLTGPYNYYRGLKDRPDVLAILWDLGIRYLRTFGRDAHDWQPVPLSWQPFWYEPQGYPDMLELMIHGWQDCIWREEYGWDNHDAYVAEVSARLEEAHARGAVFSYLQHDWSSLRGDPDLAMTRTILEKGLRLGLTFDTGRGFYQRALSARDRTADKALGA